MATARRLSEKKRCDTCHRPRSVVDYPSSGASTCTECLNLPGALARAAQGIHEAAPTSSTSSVRPPRQPRPPKLLVRPKDTLSTGIHASNDEPNPLELAGDESPFIANDVEIDYENPTTRELAARTLARRSLLHFIKRFRPQYSAGWVHEDICRRLLRFMEDVQNKRSPRLLLMCPPRSGKSEIGSRHFAPFILGHNPEWEIIAASHTGSLAMSFSRYIRDIFRDPSYQTLFPKTKLDPTSQSVENWNTTAGGGYLSAGVGSGITGRGSHCLPLSQEIMTNYGPIMLGALIRSNKASVKVVSYDGQQLVYRRINAFITRKAKSYFRVHCGGTSFEATGEHPVCVSISGSGPSYRRVDDLRVGESLVTFRCDASNAEAQDLHEVPGVFDAVHPQSVETEGTASAMRGVESHMLERVHGGNADASKDSGLAMRGVWKSCHVVESGAREATWTGEHAPVLFQGVQRCVQEQNLCRGKPPELYEGSDNLYAVQNDILSSETADNEPPHEDSVLHKGVLQGVVEWSPYPEGYRSGFAEVLPSRVQGCEGEDEGAGRSLCRVYVPVERLASQGRGHREQHGCELGPCVPSLPYASSPGYTASTITAIECIEGELTVGDIEVEGSHNFLLPTGNLLLNCLLLDDLVRDIEAADSQLQRDNIWSWYITTAYTRLSPGGGVLAIMTTWHEDDFAGRIQQLMESGEGDRFEIVKYPAINDLGDEYLLGDDSIVQLPPGSHIPAGANMTRPMGTALHPDRYDTEAMLRIKRNFYAAGQKRMWASLYQQNPTPDDGAYFTRQMFRYYASKPHPLEINIYQAWDWAISEKAQSDYTVGVTIAQDTNDNLYVLDVYRFKMGDGQELMARVVSYAQEWKPRVIGFEDGQIFKSLQSTFVKTCSERRYYPSYEILPTLTDKMVRAQPLRGRMQIGKLWLPSEAPWVEEFKTEFLRFPAGKNDDQVDSTAHCVRLTMGKHAPRPPVTTKPLKSWKDRLKSMMSGKGGSHMAA